MFHDRFVSPTFCGFNQGEEQRKQGSPVFCVVHQYTVLPILCHPPVFSVVNNILLNNDILCCLHFSFLFFLVVSKHFVQRICISPLSLVLSTNILCCPSCVIHRYSLLLRIFCWSLIFCVVCIFFFLVATQYSVLLRICIFPTVQYFCPGCLK